jgi:hypothetical protein
MFKDIQKGKWHRCVQKKVIKCVKAKEEDTFRVGQK